MGNDVHEFDLHMEVGASWYCGDASITCEVTFPSPSGQSSITIDYDRGDEDLQGAVARAIKDIAAYMKDPEEWEEEYVRHSSDDWRKLKKAQEYIKEYRQKIEDDQRSLANHQKWLAEHETEVTRLETKLGIGRANA